jgi:ATP-dependent Clp protease adaptor protein ClpS
MLNVHRAGIGLAGVYPFAVAETKVAKVHRMAEDEGFPLRCSIEPE